MQQASYGPVYKIINRAGSGDPATKAGTQTVGRLTVKLTDAGLTDAQYSANFFEVELFVIVERQHQLFAFWQRFNGLCQLCLE